MSRNSEEHSDLFYFMHEMRIGVDLTHTSRFTRIFEKHGERFVRRFLSEEEILLWRVSSSPDRFLASRWSAKEALTKAIGTKLPFSGVQVESSGKSAPMFRAVSEEWKRELAGTTGVSLSISHDLDLAIAMVAVR